jgi:hypothetical protein
MWTNPDPWECYHCGATGIGGRPAGEEHARTAHAPVPKPVGPVVPEGICASDVRTWGNRNGWNLGKRGRLPREVIDAYLAAHKPRPRVDLEVVDDLRRLGNTTVQIAHRLGVTTDAIEKAESRRRTA